MGWKITAREIVNWANGSRDAQGLFPELIRRLISSSCNPSRLHFPSGDSVQITGWDGFCEVQSGNSFVPCGISGWEIGTGVDAKRKAEGDIRKRVGNSLGFNKEETTYVQVTSSRWPEAREWSEKKNAEAGFKDVRVLDADDIEAWLDQCPSVQVWLKRRMGQFIDGVISIDKAWDIWSSKTTPPCSAELITANREANIVGLEEFLLEDPNHLVIVSESYDEAEGFIYAALDNNLKKHESRAVLITQNGIYENIIENKNPLIIIVRSGVTFNAKLGVNGGHHVISLGNSNSIPGKSLTLLTQKYSELDDALLEMGVSQLKTSKLINDSNKRVFRIRRHPLLVSEVQDIEPWWNPTIDIIPAVLIGSWNRKCERDRHLVELIAGEKYNEYEKNLLDAGQQYESAIKKKGNILTIISKISFWPAIRKKLSIIHIERFEKVIELIKDELFATPPDFIDLSGSDGRYSPYALKGVIDSLALLSSKSSDLDHMRETYPIAHRVEGVGARLYVDNTSFWNYGARYFKSFAEAAPEYFLDFLEKCLVDPCTNIKDIFVESNSFSTGNHTELMFALATLAWSEDYFSRVVRILVKLDVLDPKGNTNPRPFELCKSFFRSWHPQTMVGLDGRVEVFKEIVEENRDFTWKLAVSLLSGHMDFTHITSTPEYREWGLDWKQPDNDEDKISFNEFLATTIVGLLDEENLERYKEASFLLGGFPKEVVTRAFAKFYAVKDRLDFVSRDAILKELKSVERRNKKAFEEGKVDLEIRRAFQDLVDEYTPKSLIDELLQLFKSRWYMDWDRDDGKSWDDRNEELSINRLKAVNDLWEQGAFEKIEDVLHEVEELNRLGVVLSEAPFSDDLEDKMIIWLHSDNSEKSEVARNYIRRKAELDKNFVARSLSRYTEIWNEELFANFCLALPFGKAAFTALRQLPANVSNLYWSKINYVFFQGADPDIVNWMYEQLFAVKNYFPIIDSCPLFTSGKQKLLGISPQIIVDTLKKSVFEFDNYIKRDRNIRFDFEHTIKWLQENPETDKSQVKLVEYIYLDLFCVHSKFFPVHLIAKVLGEPRFFQEMMESIFCPRNIEDKEEYLKSKDDIQKIYAEKAYKLLNLINRIPGQKNDTDIDGAFLNNWVFKAKDLCHQIDRKELGEEYVGQILSMSPEGADGIWPHETVREVLEHVQSKRVENGLSRGKYNGFGMAEWKGDGSEELKKANKCYDNAKELQRMYPATARALRDLGESYERDAARNRMDDE